MQRIPGIILIAFLTVIAFSCIDRDILNISDSVEMHSSYSLPIGQVHCSINDYFESLDTVTYPWPDTLAYNDILYPTYAKSVMYTSMDPFVFNIVDDPSEKVKSIELVVLMTNTYPTAAAVQVYFLADSSLVPVDSLFSSGPRDIQPGGIDSDGVVNDAFTALFTIPMSDQFISGMSNITGIMVRSTINVTSTDCEILKFYDDYQLLVNLACRTELQYNTGQ